MENNEKNKSDKNLESTSSKLISMYRDVLENLNKIRISKNNLEDEQRKLKVEIAKKKSYLEDLKEQLVKAKREVEAGNSRLNQKIEQLTRKKYELEEELMSMKKDSAFGTVTSAKGLQQNRIIAVVSGVVLEMLVILIIAGIVSSHALPLIIMGIVGSIPFVIFLTFILYFSISNAHLVSNMDLKDLQDDINKIDKKINKYKKRLKVPYQQLSVYEELKSDLLAQINQNKYDIKELEEELDSNRKKIEAVQYEENEVTRLKENIEDKIGDNTIPGIIEEKEKTSGEDVIGKRQKQYKKTKNKGSENNWDKRKG